MDADAPHLEPAATIEAAAHAPGGIGRDANAVQPPRHTRLSATAGAFLDLLRAAAAHAVVFGHTCNIYHFAPSRFAAGSVGVIVFFLLSGFLITQSMLARTREREANLPRFLADRSARILTPYVPALVVIALVTAIAFPAEVGQTGLNRGWTAFFGNLLLLQDYPVFQLADLAHHPLAWRIRPYDTAEPFWTVAIEYWIYIAAGLLFFTAIRREPIRKAWLVVLAALSIPVAIWNSVAGGGNCLSLVWAIGALAGYILFTQRASTTTSKFRQLASMGILFGAIGLAARVAKIGFDPFDMQVIAMGALVIFALTALANTIDRPPAWFLKTATAAASYSYSLYLVHNSVLWMSWFYTKDALPPLVSAGLAVVAANALAYVLYVTCERHHRAVARRLAPWFGRCLVPARRTIGE